MISDLEILEKQIATCMKCPLGKLRNKPVPGEGNSKAPIFIIGEAPGYEEDLSGKPFVGRSGELLDKIFTACGFTRDEHLFIGNILKCRPPNNRTPSPEEIKSCIPYLLRQIELIDPKILILLGASALTTLVDKKLKISQVRGNWILETTRWIMPVYHPSALLRNPSLKRDTWEDFKKIILKYRELVNPEHSSKYI